MAINQIQSGDTALVVRGILNSAIESNITVDQFASFFSEQINLQFRSAGLLSNDSYETPLYTDWVLFTDEVIRLTSLGFKWFMVPLTKIGSIGFLEVDRNGVIVSYNLSKIEEPFTRANSPENAAISGTFALDANGLINILSANEPRWTYRPWGQTNEFQSKFLELQPSYQNLSVSTSTTMNGTTIEGSEFCPPLGRNLNNYVRTVTGQTGYRSTVDLPAGDSLIVWYWKETSGDSGCRVEGFSGSPSIAATINVRYNEILSTGSDITSAYTEPVGNGFYRIVGVVNVASPTTGTFFDFEIGRGSGTVGDSACIGGYQIIPGCSEFPGQIYSSGSVNITRQSDSRLDVDTALGFELGSNFTFQYQMESQLLDGTTSYWQVGFNDSIGLVGYFRVTNLNGINYNLWNQRDGSALGNGSLPFDVTTGLHKFAWSQSPSQISVYQNGELVITFDKPSSWGDITRAYFDHTSSAFGSGKQVQRIKMINVSTVVDEDYSIAATSWTSPEQMAYDLNFEIA